MGWSRLCIWLPPGPSPWFWEFSLYGFGSWFMVITRSTDWIWVSSWFFVPFFQRPLGGFWPGGLTMLHPLPFVFLYVMETGSGLDTQVEWFGRRSISRGALCYIDYWLFDLMAIMLVDEESRVLEFRGWQHIEYLAVSLSNILIASVHGLFSRIYVGRNLLFSRTVLQMSHSWFLFFWLEYPINAMGVRVWSGLQRIKKKNLL